MSINGIANMIDPSTLRAAGYNVGQGVYSAIRSASAQTGVDFAYLIEQAAAESSFQPDIAAKTSSASGLYQFIEKTWLHMVREHGDKYGMGSYAAQIDENCRVDNPQTRQKILALRNDPDKAAAMAAELAADNKRALEQVWGGDVGATELYFAHFLGAGQAAAFLEAKDRDPMQAAADIFPQAARANRNVFYDRETGRPRTLAGVYEYFDAKFGRFGTSEETGTTVTETRSHNTAETAANSGYTPSPSPELFGWLNGQGMVSMEDYLGADANTKSSFSSFFGLSGLGGTNLLSHPVELMLLAQLEPYGCCRGLE